MHSKIWSNLLFSAIVLIAGCTGYSNNDYYVDEQLLSDGLNTFIELALENYPNWLQQNNLDPHPTVEGPRDLSSQNTLVQLDCIIGNYTVSGISKRLVIQSAVGDLLNGFLSVRYYLRDNITFTGDYKANGTVLSSIPLEGEGKWTIVYEELEQEFQFKNFKITDGFIDLSEASFYHMSLAQLLYLFEFEGLFDNGAGGFEEEVKTSLLDQFKNFLYDGNDASHYPASDAFNQYFQGIFSKTPLSEIIGTTRPPSTTESVSSTVTTEDTEPTSPPSTCEPCSCSTMQNNEVVLDNSIAEMIFKDLDQDLKERIRGLRRNWTMVIKFDEDI